MQKILALNSGGFDSIVMLHELRRMYPEAEIHSMHFQYGARNDKQQYAKVVKACEKLNCKNVTLTLPEFFWSKRKFFQEMEESTSKDDVYLEYRNLIFISYAVSYAESQGIKDIFFADVHTGSWYNDTDPTFFKGMNVALSRSLITIHTPYASIEKEDLMDIAHKIELKREDFFSCDYPDENGNPCGKCFKCRDVNAYAPYLSFGDILANIRKFFKKM